MHAVLRTTPAQEHFKVLSAARLTAQVTMGSSSLLRASRQSPGNCNRMHRPVVMAKRT